MVHVTFLLAAVLVYALILLVATGLGGYVLGYAFRRGWERAAPRR